MSGTGGGTRPGWARAHVDRRRADETVFTVRRASRCGHCDGTGIIGDHYAAFSCSDCNGMGHVKYDVAITRAEVAANHEAIRAALRAVGK